jgi:AN1-type zinc finger protein 5/6
MDTSTKKSKKPRCFHCKKKLTLIELNFRCKCNHVYCQVHLNPHSHNCSVNYLQDKQTKIKENNPKMCVQCIEVK